jgi:hypothetical protein
MNRFSRALRLLGAIGLLAGGLSLPPSGAAAQGDSHFFPETKHTVAGVFWTYWQGHGGLAQQGYPISDEMQEKSDLNGQTYTVQYFERAVFEKHPENQPPYDVLLSQLGTFRYKAKYGAAGAPGQQASPANPRRFPETNHTIGGAFRAYWESHGGLAQQGYPISDEFTEVSDLNGQPYTVQYFERAVFEKHPENQPPYDVLLSQLGTFQYKQKYQSAKPTPQPAPESGHTNKDADVNPRCGVAGTNFTFVGRNFTPNEGLSFWFTAPNGAVVGTSSPQFAAPGNGQFSFPIPTTAEFAQFPGWWAMTWQGSYSQHQSIGWFYIARSAGECAGIGGATPPPAPPTQVSGGSCDVSGTKDGSATPSSVQVGGTVTIRAFGFTPNEPLSLWFTAPNGSVVGTSSPNFLVPAEGGFTLPINTRPSADVAFGPGRWAITFEGAYSHHQSVVFFCVTP